MKRELLMTLALLAAIGCGERITAPGLCPEYCPDDRVVLHDTLLLSAVQQDSTFSGFVPAFRAGSMQLVTNAGGVEAIGVARFFAYAESLLVRPNDTIRAPVTAIDSFRLEIPVTRRTATLNGLQLEIFRLPAAVDTTADFASLTPYFQDSTRLATVDVPDSLSSGRFLAVIPGDAFPTFDADGRVGALGFRLVAPSATYLELGTLDANNSILMTRFARIDSSGTSVGRSEGRLPALDTYLPTATPPSPAGALVAGGVPSSRAFLRVNVPAHIVDSATVVRATLVLVPQSPVVGAVGDTLQLVATGITADFGAKSPLVPVPADSLILRLGRVAIGSADTIRLDVTDLLRGWTADPDRPRTFVVRAVPEGGSLAAVAFGGSTGGAAPTLQVTWIPPVALGDR